MKTFRLVPIVFVLALTMCSGPEIINKTTDDPIDFIYSADKSVRYNGDYLEFSSPEVLQRVIEKLSTSTAKGVLTWENQFGFKSQMSLYEETSLKQANYIKELGASLTKDKSPAEIEQLTKPAIDNTTFVGLNAHIFVFDQDGLVRGLKIFHSGYARVVNANGLLKVAGHIFQYNQTNIKIILDGDPKKIALLATTEVTDKENGIDVVPVTKKTTAGNGRYGYYEEGYSSEFYVTQTLRHFGQIQLSYYGYPIYSGRTLCSEGCNNLPGPEERTQDEDNCYCYQEIIGYASNTVYESHTETQEVFLWWWIAFRPRQTEIYVSWAIDYATQPTAYWTNFDAANLWITMYNGPGVNVTHGYHQYRVYFDPFPYSNPFPYGHSYVQSFTD